MVCKVTQDLNDYLAKQDADDLLDRRVENYLDDDENWADVLEEAAGDEASCLLARVLTAYNGKDWKDDVPVILDAFNDTMTEIARKRLINR